ncbi:transposase [Alicyclobacillus tolerans]|uniref:transposase n=1 Tax=Alicyclobacillus tolerans TaxID=90970 RepID=UPI003557E761|nr:transposase [Alicyclobacillus tolerans]
MDTTKQYDKGFKLHAVQLAMKSGKPSSRVAHELGVSQKTLNCWMFRPSILLITSIFLVA